MSSFTTHNQQVPEISRTYLVIAAERAAPSERSSAYYSDFLYLPSLDKSNERPIVCTLNTTANAIFIASWLIGACSSVISALLMIIQRLGSFGNATFVAKFIRVRNEPDGGRWEVFCFNKLWYMGST